MLEEDNTSSQNNERPINNENINTDNKGPTAKTIETPQKVNRFNDNEGNASDPQHFTQK